MAISQVSKGVYVISPEKVETQGGKYITLFTKNREEQWQLAQKQAGLEADIATKTYAEQLKVYRDKIDAMNAQVRDLAKMKERAMAGALTAQDRAELESWRLQARRDEKLAEKTTMTAPGTTTSTTTGVGGRAGKGPQLGEVDSNSELEINAALASAAGDPATAAAAVAAARQSKTLGSSTPEDTDAQNYKVVNDLADIRAASTGEDIDTATDNILLELSKTDPQYAASHARVESKKAEIEKGTGGGTRTTTTTRTGGQYRVEKYPGLADTPGAGPEIPVESREGMLADIAAQRAALEEKIRAEQMPQFAGFDYITRARQIAAGRFGPTPASPAYGERNALQALMQADPAMRQAVLDQYRASIPKTAAPGAPAVGTTPGAAAPAGAAAPSTPAGWEAVGIVRPSDTDPEVVARAKASGKTPQQEAEAAYQAAKDAWSAAQGARTPTITMPAEEFPMAPGLGVAGLTREAVEVGAEALKPGLDPGARSALQQLADTKFAAAQKLAGQEARIEAETAAAERPFQIPFEQRGGETVPFFRRPGGFADQRAMEQAYLEMQDARGRRAPPMGTYPTATEPPAVTPVAPTATAPVTPLVTPPSVPDVTAVPPTDIRPEAAALMTPQELEAARIDLKRRLEERAAVQQMLAEQSAAMTPYTGPSPALTKAMETQFIPPPATTRSMLPPAMPQPVVAAAQLGDIRVPSGAVPTPPSIGRYTPGPVPVSTPMEGPSAALAAPRTAAAAPEGYFDRPSRPLAANMGAQMAIREGEEAVEATTAAKKQMADMKAVGAQDYFRGPAPTKTETKETYLFNRLQSAYPLAKKADKLDRVIASGPGKVAYDLYVANKAKNIPFTKTYEEITMTFAGDRKAMEQAHNVALALDIKDSDKVPGGK
jgi:hypothetical protein